VTRTEVQPEVEYGFYGRLKAAPGEIAGLDDYRTLAGVR